ncbi:hypothetical protein [Nostoc sp. C052]|nr:hypothetical protein [Nostoc sp. C052]
MTLATSFSEELTLYVQPIVAPIPVRGKGIKTANLAGWVAGGSNQFPSP